MNSHPSAPAFRVLAVCFVATLCVPSVSPAQKTDVVTLKRGDVLTGEIKQLSRGKLTYKTDDLGTVYIEWEKIAHVESEHFFEVEVESGVKYFGRLGRTDTPGEAAVILADTVILRLHRVVFIVPIRDSFWARVDGFVNLGVDFTKANNLRTLNLDGQATYRGTRWSVRLNGTSYVQGQDSVETTSRNQLGVQITRLLSGKWNVLGVTSVEQNSQLGLDLRITVGAGRPTICSRPICMPSTSEEPSATRESSTPRAARASRRVRTRVSSAWARTTTCSGSYSEGGRVQ